MERLNSLQFTLSGRIKQKKVIDIDTITLKLYHNSTKKTHIAASYSVCYRYLMFYDKASFTLLKKPLGLEENSAFSPIDTA